MDLLPAYMPLHSNMFLLILQDEDNPLKQGESFTFQYVSINTANPAAWIITAIVFTFQYVSINTNMLNLQELH